MEQDSNAAKTTLTADYTAGDGHIDVVTTAVPFPTSPTFRVAILNSTETTIKVILKVTAITSSTRWAVTAEGTDANASNGDHVIGPWYTQGAIEGIIADTNGLGTYANRPSSGMRTGQTYHCTDSPYSSIYDGSGWKDWFHGYPVTMPPAVSGLTWINQGGASADDTKGGIAIYAPATGSTSLRCLVKSKTGNYTFTIGQVQMGRMNNFLLTGLILRESGSGKIVKFGTWSNNPPGLGVEYFTNATTFSSAPKEEDQFYQLETSFFQVVKDNTNWTFNFSKDGQHFAQFYQVAVASLFSGMVPDQIGVCVDDENSRDQYVWFFHWGEA